MRRQNCSSALPQRLRYLPVQDGEERSDVASGEFGFLGGGEVPAAGHHGPAADVVEAFGPLSRWLALGDEHVREYRHRGGHVDHVAGTEAWLTLPAAVVVVVAYRRGDRPRDPVQGHDPEQ